MRVLVAGQARSTASEGGERERTTTTQPRRVAHLHSAPRSPSTARQGAPASAPMASDWAHLKHKRANKAPLASTSSPPPPPTPSSAPPHPVSPPGPSLQQLHPRTLELTLRPQQPHRPPPPSPTRTRTSPRRSRSAPSPAVAAASSPEPPSAQATPSWPPHPSSRPSTTSTTRRAAPRATAQPTTSTPRTPPPAPSATSSSARCATSSSTAPRRARSATGPSTSSSAPRSGPRQRRPRARRRCPTRPYARSAGCCGRARSRARSWCVPSPLPEINLSSCVG